MACRMVRTRSPAKKTARPPAIITSRESEYSSAGASACRRRARLSRAPAAAGEVYVFDAGYL